MAGFHWPTPLANKYRARSTYYCLHCGKTCLPNPQFNKQGHRLTTLCPACGQYAQFFSSNLEFTRYLDLHNLEIYGDISDLELQPRFPIKIKNPQGVEILVTTYVADFRYKNKEGKEVVEDVKGFKTAIYRLKKKLVKAYYGISILET